MKRTTLVTGAALVLDLAAIPFIFRHSPYVLGVLSTASVLSFISLGVWLTFAIGRINIGQAAFALVGGYTTAVLMTKYGISFWLALPASGLVAAAVGLVIGWPILRLRGVYFAMLTLSLSEAARLSALNFDRITQGAHGILDIPTPGRFGIFGFTLAPPFSTVNEHVAFYYLAALLLIVGLLVVWRIAHSRLGWIFRSLLQDEALAASIGVDVAKYRVMAFALCAAFGGVGGAFFTVSQQSIYPSSFGVSDSIFFMLYCFLGGLSYVGGPVVGAFVLFLCFEVLAGFREYQTLIYATVMIVAMLWLPNGLLSLRLPLAGGRQKTPGAMVRSE